MNVDIAQRLAARRKQAGLSQETLAEQLGVSRQAVSKWERSESSPDTDNLIALAQLYGVSLDDLLYVDDEIKDDVVFEAADKAPNRSPEAAEGAVAAGVASDATTGYAACPDDFRQAGFGDAAASGASASSSCREEGGKSSKSKAKVHVGFDGIHVLDGDDYVHVSWRDGVHVKDGKKGDEVHVGWGGIHVKEASANTQTASQDGNWSNQAASAQDAADGAGAGSASSDTQPEGAYVVVNGEYFDDWREASARYGHSWGDASWREPCGYTVKGERFDTMDEARAKYGPEVGKAIPVRKHYLREFEKSWLKFPYPLVIILVYLLLGTLNGAWGVGLFLFFTIPVYYMVGHAVGRRRIAPLIAGTYPIAVIAWFCYMAFMLSQPHPAWAIFLTIPIVEWLVHSLSRWWHTRKGAKEAKETTPIDV